MNAMKYALALGALSLSTVALAVQQQETEASYEIIAYDSNDQVSSAADTGSGTASGSDTAQVARESSETARNDFGLDTRLSGSAGATRLVTENDTSWKPDQRPDQQTSLFTTRAKSSTGEGVQAGEAGKTRFNLSYTLRAEGQGSFASFFFSASFFHAVPHQSWADVETISFGRELSILDGKPEISGTWTSDWITFSSEDELQQIGENFTYGYSLWTESTTSLNAATLSFEPVGRSYSYVDVRFGQEIAPVPEPETYALMAVGLGAVVAARRRKQRA